MNEKLLYDIAGHKVIIETPDVKVTSRLLHTFNPFRVLSSDYNNILFRFKGDQSISIPNTVPAEELDLGGILFRVYLVENTITVNMKINELAHSFQIKETSDTVICDLTLLHEYESQFLAYIIRAVFGVLSANRKTLKIHGSVIEKDGKALVFLGKSGTGKSTHSRLWQQFVPGCRLLNDDEPLIRVMDNGTIRVFGAPWSGSTPCYVNDSAEVAAFVHLYQSSNNELTKIGGLKAFTSIFQSSSVLRSSSKNRDLIISIVNDILNITPVYRLDNRPDREAVSLTETLIG